MNTVVMMMNKGSSFMGFEPISMDDEVFRGFFSGFGLKLKVFLFWYLPMELQREESLASQTR